MPSWHCACLGEPSRRTDIVDSALGNRPARGGGGCAADRVQLGVGLGSAMHAVVRHASDESVVRARLAGMLVA